MSDSSPDSATRPEHRHDHDVDHPFFAACYDHLPEPEAFEAQRTYLARDLSGRALELGCGTGHMFPYVVEGASGDLEYHAIEPDPHMRKRAVEAARDSGLAVDLRDARAESLPYPDDSFDVVLAGVVFCTVQDPDAALEEVVRVLKPGGEFRFLEHVGADGWRGTGQKLLDPVWKRVAGGCHLTRDTVARFVGHEALAVEEIDRVDVSVFPATPVVRGTLRRRENDVLG
ncbi:Methyltransferase type 11 [Haloterrigena turkmenica DSM 5511]|uniref:Methyltransferase type 11 n=1 Tax=Haloterrigena turkmenica (strain ATCC 51198 / DSM 5511 / JCM 9101 / NCIMB 13204 / VKM B-1734 / 4k) TaxID=543526 RepID=D2RXF5_HALTV|nr:class I SAM-dependent methyltransferase [Haloterrigena turkmenica]ADB61679.1 Methyltransferase type 11 [Haloterrigena turkmenica DSM 5511]